MRVCLRLSETVRLLHVPWAHDSYQFAYILLRAA
jgi:hypothetical protein